MNSIVQMAHIFLLFYMVSCFFETESMHYHLDVQQVTRHSIWAALCAMTTFISSTSIIYFVMLIILVLYPILAYHHQEGFQRHYLHWCILLVVSYLGMLIIRYVVSILPAYGYQIHFGFDLMTINFLALSMLLYFQWTKIVKEALYAVVVCFGLLLVMLCSLTMFYEDTNMMETASLLFPIALLFCFLILFRCGYAMQESANSVLKLTVKHYTEKENQEKYETLEKENKMIMQQLHDMKKHLQILEDMEAREEDTKRYQQDILAKAEEMLYMKQSGVPLIDRILQTYRPRFQAAHIQCNVEVDEIDFHFMSTIDVSAMLANLLDNAIESCLRCEERFLLLKIKKQRDIIILKMKNSCRYIQEKQGVLETTKSDLLYHGYGMRNMDMIAKKYGGVLTYQFDEEHHIFITTISLFPNRS